MARRIIHLALFKEDQVDETSEALEALRGMGIVDQDISVISGTPFSEKMLGRPMSWTNVPLIGAAGAVVGFIAAAALNFGTPLLYPIRVGGMPLQTIPTSFIIFFELTMLGLLIATFLGVFIEMISPSFGPAGLRPAHHGWPHRRALLGSARAGPQAARGAYRPGCRDHSWSGDEKAMAVLKRLIIALSLAIVPLAARAADHLRYRQA